MLSAEDLATGLTGRWLRACAVAAFGLAAASAPAAAAEPPPIRTSAANPVPACVTPERLMAFLATRNHNLEPRFRDIASLYKRHGEAWGVRWDYAFFQMAIETNFLTYQRGNGRRGDVVPKQNNFAGIGTTGGGVPGDGYPDVSTGVLAQIQHLVVYSGERIEQPVAPRTRLKQDDILRASGPIAEKRPVTFKDLAGRWAADKAYGRSIETVAERFRETYCRGEQAPAQVVSHGKAGQLGSAQSHAAQGNDPQRRPGATPPCRVQVASYGGTKTLLIRGTLAGEERYTALQVHAGFERSMAESFIRMYAPGGVSLGEFASTDAALARAYELCPAGTR